VTNQIVGLTEPCEHSGSRMTKQGLVDDGVVGSEFGDSAPADPCKEYSKFIARIKVFQFSRLAFSKWSGCSKQGGILKSRCEARGRFSEVLQQGLEDEGSQKTPDKKHDSSPSLGGETPFLGVNVFAWVLTLIGDHMLLVNNL